MNDARLGAVSGQAAPDEPGIGSPAAGGAVRFRGRLFFKCRVCDHFQWLSPPANAADPELEERLRMTEAEGVLADMVERAVKFYRGGRVLSPPLAVAKATADYRRRVAEVLAERTLIAALGRCGSGG